MTDATLFDGILIRIKQNTPKRTPNTGVKLGCPRASYSAASEPRTLRGPNTTASIKFCYILMEYVFRHYHRERDPVSLQPLAGI